MNKCNCEGHRGDSHFCPLHGEVIHPDDSVKAEQSPQAAPEAGSECMNLLCVSEPQTEPTSVKVQTIDKDGNKQWETIELPADGTPVEIKGVWPPLQVNT